MKKFKIIRNYTLSDASLKQKADEMIDLLDRDFVEFAERRYNAAAKSLFVEKRDLVNAMPSDETLEALKMGLTEQKETARIALEKTMRTIFNMATNHFGVQSAHFRSFGAINLRRQREAELARAYKMMAKAAQKYLDQMVAEGLSQNLINQLLVQGETYNVAIDDVSDAIVQRDIATEDRILAHNALFDLMMKYAGIGKDIFYDASEAKYNDYVIYDVPKGKATDDPVI